MNKPRKMLHRLIPVHRMRIASYEQSRRQCLDELNTIMMKIECEQQMIKTLNHEYESFTADFHISSQHQIFSHHQLLITKLHIKDISDKIAHHQLTLLQARDREREMKEKINEIKNNILIYSKKMEKIKQALLLVKD